ncbi:TonB-dependent receptor [Arcticibacter eurypsychrophilus]|uniref:TonB-dependent receptor n=1 Tax=Arcticibacter eurypsychrophilus TaxID=1434752 RepID=UPI00084CF593|nr:TonB-dependent receptor [Arcticibacter eurypsychrophilus]
MKQFLFLFFTCLCTTILHAQGSRAVSGIVLDSTNVSVIAASIKLTSAKDTLFTRSDVDGKFSFRNVKSSQFVLSVTSLGYKNFSQRFQFAQAATPLKLSTVILKVESNLLNTVNISGVTPIMVKEDTIQYSAKDFPVRENSVVEDVLKKLPGIEVDKDGNVTTQGKSVTRVRVNGKDFFDGDLKTATQNLPADVIENIQIIDDYGDQANASGIRDGDPDKILNITISPSKNKGMIANGVAGGGNDNRYIVSGMGRLMNNDEQLSMMLNLNNTNANLFDFAGGGNQRGGRFRGSGGGRGGNAGGITNTQAGGFDYRKDVSKKITVFGSYRVSSSDNNAKTDRFTETTTGDQLITTTQRSNNNSNNLNQGLNFNLEYKIDSLNYLKVAPSLNLSTNKNDGDSYKQIQELVRQDQNTRSSNESSSPAFGADILYNKRFLKQGRNLSLNYSINKSYNKNDQDISDAFNFYDTGGIIVAGADSSSRRLINTDNERLSNQLNVTYSEPLGVYSRLDFSYRYSRTENDNSKITDLADVNGAYFRSDSLSNIFNYSFTANRFGLSYRYDRNKLYNFSIGMAAQPTTLKGYSETNHVSAGKTGFNVFPTVRFSYNFAKTVSLKINYSGESSEPGFEQIQPVVDLSNPQSPVIGNPNLRSALNQNVNIEYNNTDAQTGAYFSAGARGNIISDRIINNTVRIREPIISGTDTTYNLIQERRFLNEDGYYASNVYYRWSKPFMDKKYRLQVGGTVNYTNDVSYVDNEKNIGKNWTFSQNARFQINPNENIDITPGASYRYGFVNYSLPNSIDSKNSTLSLDLNAKIYVFNTWILGFDGSKNINSGFRSINANPLVINSYLEKQMFNRKGRLRLQGYDLLNQAATVNATQGDNGYSVSNTNRLTRYFMLTFAYRFNKFAGRTQNNRGDMPPGGGERREGGFNPGGGGGGGSQGRDQ